MSVVVAVAAFVVVVTLLLAVKFWRRARDLERRYAPILNVDEAVAGLQKELEGLASEKQSFLAEDTTRRVELNERYKAEYDLFSKLKAQTSLLEENMEDMSFGLYKPHYAFDSSDKYKEELQVIWEQKKASIRSGTAAFCSTSWTVRNSVREGERMTKQQIKLMLRAFNGECDAAVSRVTWNNVSKMEERINKAFDAINAMGGVMQISISTHYRNLALAELRLTHEYEVKKHDEAEEQRHIREQMREEERAQREFERAQQEAAAEESRYAKALAKARAEVEKSEGEALQKANAKVQELEQKLAEAQELMKRAKSMAEITKSGHVYVISNIGSFGEKVFKIGMTRRLDPMERVHELGDASVPFAFDVHAMIYSENAPGLENEFHRYFAQKRVNLVNMRKEYFNVSLAEIEAFAREQGVAVEFTKLAEAREYRETLAMLERSAIRSTAPAVPPEGFPAQLNSEPPATVRATG